MIQRRATKYILSTGLANYKTRLIQTNLLPTMYWFEQQDILFMIKCFNKPPENFDIWNYMSFSKTTTRSSSTRKLTYKHVRTNMTRHFYFNRIVRLWNSLPQIDLSLSLETLKKKLYNHFWAHFIANFDSSNICSFHIVCPCSKCVFM